MPIGMWNVEFLSGNSQRHYPLADDADGVDDSDSFRLPTDFLVEADLPIHAGMDVEPARFFVYKIGAFQTGYSIIVAYQPVSGSPVIAATALIPRDSFTKNSTYVLGGVGVFSDTIGKVVINSLDNIDEQPPGFWTFEFDHGRLDPDAVRPIIRGVSSIVCVSGEQRSVPLQGDIELVAGNNFQLTVITLLGADPIIRLSAISGEGTVEDCVCEGDAAPIDPIRTINGIGPTAAGDFNILASSCIEIEALAHGIRLVDKCAAPCCGCTELERITDDLKLLGREKESVRDFVNQLANTVTALQMSVLGSRLADSGCVDCG